MSIKNNFPNVRPSLTVDFRNSETVDPRLASVRASTATFTDQFGVIQTALSNVPRITFDPVTGECLGLMREAQRTNLLIYSQDFSNAAWTKTNLTVESNVILAPDGTLTADKLIADATTTTHRVQRTIYYALNTYTESVYAQAGENRFIQLAIAYYAQSTFDWSNFDLINGTVQSFGSAIGKITNIGNGWFRCETIKNTGSGAGKTYIAIATSLSSSLLPIYLGDGVSGLYIWGSQLEVGAYASSYIPTVASQVTRAADSATMTGVNFTSWYGAGGTMIVDVNMPVSGIILTAGTTNMRSPVNGERIYGQPFFPETTNTLTLGVGTFSKITYYASYINYSGLITPVGAPSLASFVMTVFISANGGTFQWPNRTGTRNATIDWGDGTSETSVGNLAVKTYALAGYYDISVTGTYTAPFFNNGGDRLKCVDVRQWGSVTGMTTWNSSFYGCANLVGTATDAPVLIGSLQSMFQSCTAFNGAISSWNTGAVTNMSYMFLSATAFNQNIGSWNTSAVTNMAGMFQSASAFNQNIGSWNTNTVTNMNSMFLVASAFNQDLSGMTTSLTAQPTNFSAGANATFANNANGLKPFLSGGVTQINT